MSIDKPDAAALLALARDTLKEQILPSLPGERTLDVLMVMRALEIAARALAESDDALDRRERSRLETLPGSGGDPAVLATAIRAGDWDGVENGRTLHAMLTVDVRDRLARVNPKYLAILDDGTGNTS